MRTYRASLLCMLIASTLGSINTATARDYYVSPRGSDKNQGGSKLRPFATLKKACNVVKPGDKCFLLKGTYRETLRPLKSGEPRRPITFMAYRNDEVIISGADAVTGWTKEKDDVYSTPIKLNFNFGNQVFANGKMLIEARWPNSGTNFLFQPNRASASGGNDTTLICKDIPGGKDAWKGAKLWCAGGVGWISWTVDVSGYDHNSHTLEYENEHNNRHWYRARKGNPFVLHGLRRCLDAPGEWFYDGKAKRLLVIPPDGTDIKKLTIEAKRRKDVIDLSGLSHIRIGGIQFRAGGIRMDKKTSNTVLQNLKGRYVSHNYTRSVSSDSGVLVRGKSNLALSCDFGYSSASVLSVSGEDNRIINCYIHHGGYAGLWQGTVLLSGRRILFSHNTVRHAGRDLINTHGLMESLVQYNDVSDAGWLTTDLGMFYGHNTDFANTRFCYNLVHDNHAKHCSMGIYFDHCSHNVIVDHNIIWNVGMDPVRINNPSYGNLAINNSSWKSGGITTFDHAKRNDLFASRYCDNIFNKPVRLPKHVVTTGNLISGTPPFVNASKLDFRLKDDTQTKAGAIPPKAAMWKAGHDFENPPKPLPVYKPARIPWMNMVKNACFEFKTTEEWTTTGARKATLIEGNGWGNKVLGTDVHATGTSKKELQLGPGKDGVTQTIKSLNPGTKYTLSAWLRVSGDNDKIILGVKGHGGKPVEAVCTSKIWVRKSIEFTTGAGARKATIYITTGSGTKGKAWCDNLTLPLAQRISDK